MLQKKKKKSESPFQILLLLKMNFLLLCEDQTLSCCSFCVMNENTMMYLLLFLFIVKNVFFVISLYLCYITFCYHLFFLCDLNYICCKHVVKPYIHLFLL